MYFTFPPCIRLKRCHGVVWLVGLVKVAQFWGLNGQLMDHVYYYELLSI